MALEEKMKTVYINIINNLMDKLETNSIEDIQVAIGALNNLIKPKDGYRTPEQCRKAARNIYLYCTENGPNFLNGQAEIHEFQQLMMRTIQRRIDDLRNQEFSRKRQEATDKLVGLGLRETMPPRMQTAFRTYPIQTITLIDAGISIDVLSGMQDDARLAFLYFPDGVIKLMNEAHVSLDKITQMDTEVRLVILSCPDGVIKLMNEAHVSLDKITQMDTEVRLVILNCPDEVMNLINNANLSLDEITQMDDFLLNDILLEPAQNAAAIELITAKGMPIAELAAMEQTERQELLNNPDNYYNPNNDNPTSIGR